MNNKILPFVFFSLALLWRCQTFSQCNIRNIQSSSSLYGDCGNYVFQGTIGSVVNSYGSCGTLFFTPPLTGGDQTTSTSDPLTEKISVNPNPVFDFIEIVFDSDTDNYTIEIINSLGRSLKSKHSVSHREQLDVTDLLTGIYFIKISKQNKIILTKKFIKI